MTPEQRELLATHANNATLGAYSAHLDAMRPDLTAADRAEHARRARELAAYARELLAIVRESEPVAAPVARASDAEWLVSGLVRIACMRDGVTLSAGAGRIFCQIKSANFSAEAPGDTIADAFAGALDKDGGVVAMNILAGRPAR